MNTSTPAKVPIRRSGRASKAPDRLTSPGYDVERPRHRSPTPMDATTWSLSYLRRQGLSSQPWFRHLDFVNMAEEDIKKLFWTPTMGEKHRQYVPVPLALRRDPRTILSFYNKGVAQKRKQVEIYSLHNDDQYYRDLYRSAAEDRVIPEALVFPCPSTQTNI